MNSTLYQCVQDFRDFGSAEVIESITTRSVNDPLNCMDNRERSLAHNDMMSRCANVSIVLNLGDGTRNLDRCIYNRKMRQFGSWLTES